MTQKCWCKYIASGQKIASIWFPCVTSSSGFHQTQYPSFVGSIWVFQAHMYSHCQAYDIFWSNIHQKFEDNFNIDRIFFRFDSLWWLDVVHDIRWACLKKLWALLETYIQPDFSDPWLLITFSKFGMYNVCWKNAKNWRLKPIQNLSIFV